MSINMLPDQSAFARSGLPLPDGVNSGLSPAFQGDFLGLPLPDEENHWGLSPMSPSLPSWNKPDHHQGFGNAGLDRDLKNSHVRNGQPTPPPFDDGRSSQDIYPPLPQYQLGATPPSFADRGQRRSYSEHSGFDDDQSYSGAGSSSSTSNKRRKCRDAAPKSFSLDFDDTPYPGDRAKREKFLERNRLAASKCRQKKKEHTQQLETRYKEQSDKKEQLVAEIARLRSEILGLKNEVLRHAQCGDEPIKLHLAQMVKKITYNDTSTTAVETSDAEDAVPTSEDSPTPPAQQQQGRGQRRHQPQQDMVSFGFDDALQMESAAGATLEQQMRRDSEATIVSQGTYGFPSTEDSFDDLINV